MNINNNHYNTDLNETNLNEINDIILKFEQYKERNYNVSILWMEYLKQIKQNMIYSINQANEVLDAIKYENDIKLTDKQIMVLSILKMSEHNILQNNE